MAAPLMSILQLPGVYDALATALRRGSVPPHFFTHVAGFLLSAVTPRDSVARGSAVVAIISDLLKGREDAKGYIHALAVVLSSAREGSSTDDTTSSNMVCGPAVRIS